MPVVVVLGPLYGRASDRSWARGMYLTFCTLLRVPSPVYKEKKIWAAMVLNTVFMCGLFVFAVFLGLITEDVKQRVALIKEGITPVACKHHTVVCYWNESTPALLRQISKARKGRDAFQGTVVVCGFSQLLNPVLSEARETSLHRISLQLAARCRLLYFVFHYSVHVSPAGCCRQGQV